MREGGRTPPAEDLESLISERFDELAESAMFPGDLPPDDFELKAVLEWLGDVRARLVLDVGCAKGRFVEALSGLGARAVGVDRSWNLIRAASRGARGRPFVLSTAARLPLIDASCDGVLCVEVVEHLPEVGPALAEFSRVLKPGGRAIIIDKNPLGIGYHRFYPNWMYKMMMERLDRWSYPRGFAFKERWPTPWSLRRGLRHHFTTVEIRYLDGRVRGLRRRVLAPLFRLFPFLRPDVAWCCQR